MLRPAGTLLPEKRKVMYEVKVRDIPTRSLLCLLAACQQSAGSLGPGQGGHRHAQGPAAAAVDGVAGAAFLIYYGEVNQDSDGPVEFCWPVPRTWPASSPPVSPDSPCAPSLRTRRPTFTGPGPADGGAVAAPLGLVHGLGGRAAAAAQ